MNLVVPTDLRKISSSFEDDTRVVITYVALAHDEALPMDTDVIRSPGYGWTSFERVTGTITLIRHNNVAATPVATTGQSATLAQIGQLYLGTTNGLEREMTDLAREEP
ncbi:Aste57867_780 [Aphanomyces stellatus]|uniref:Aste57867_780 protein n=1 Tax=Aphanomyces stellatus TaxID=120398 RepID=A0A485K4H7_9STRA|nr:hypothetical protein As57867_000779 [Aphanomyces stellatus]VFT78004.1 Aste57867_780 [Aphanomyces stellatus]